MVNFTSQIPHRRTLSALTRGQAVAILLGIPQTFFAGALIQALIHTRTPWTRIFTSVTWLFLECAVVLAVCRYFALRRTRTRFAGYGLILATTTIYAIQILALAFGGECVSRLALANIFHVNFVVSPGIVFFMGLALVVAVWALYGFERRFTGTPTASLSLGSYCIAGAVLIAVFLTQGHWSPQLTTADRHVLMARVLPVYSFANLWISRRHRTQLTTELVNEIDQYGFYVNPQSTHPFVRNSIYSTPPPFPQADSFAKGQRSPPPNVIVFFMEGLSARTLSVYSNRHPGLTDNIGRFGKQTLVVDNYWNHTAATYRGIKGQLCSLYPLMDGLTFSQDDDARPVDYFCLPHLFQELHYETVFFSAESASGSYLDEIMPRLGFDTHLNSDEVASGFPKHPAPSRTESLSDQQFFSGLIEWMAQRDARTPFFLTAYNAGTHAFLDSRPGEKRFGDGKNRVLNTLYNFDHAFGGFWDYFQQSRFSSNTVIIFTTDHCHYSEPPYVAEFSEAGDAHLFIDKIPLLIYDPRLTAPARLDARQATSISFAPTVAHYFGLPNTANPFMGRSLFDLLSDPAANFGVAWYLSTYLFIRNGQVETIPQASATHPMRSHPLRQFFDYSAEMEVTNRIWSPSLHKAGAVEPLTQMDSPGSEGVVQGLTTRGG